MGWLNDVTTRAEGEIYNFNMARFYAKWLDDISDTQGEETGAIADTAPFVWINKPADPVCSCYIIIPWLMFQNYGDRQILTKHYKGIKKWINYIESQSVDNIIYFGVFGDWAPPIKEAVKEGTLLAEFGSRAISANTPIELVSTCYFYLNILLISKIAHILKKFNEEKAYLKKLESIKKSFNRKFFNPETSNYGSGNQACNILPLFLNLVPEENKQAVIDNIINDIKLEDYHITTGNQCTKYLIETLTEYGYIDLVYKIVTRVSYPSWGYMIKMGASTIWERWEYNTGPGMNSHNHPMNGSISSWFFKGLAGIFIEFDVKEGFTFSIKPGIPRNLNYVNANIETILGNVTSNWKFEKDVLNLFIEIPFNSRAKLHIPKIKDCDPVLVLESNKKVWENKSFFPVAEEIGISKENNYCLNIGSGSFNFKIRYKKKI